jgi:hypothetical protein
VKGSCPRPLDDGDCGRSDLFWLILEVVVVEVSSF